MTAAHFLFHSLPLYMSPGDGAPGQELSPLEQQSVPRSWLEKFPVNEGL